MGQKSLMYGTFQIDFDVLLLSTTLIDDSQNHSYLYLGTLIPQVKSEILYFKYVLFMVIWKMSFQTLKT